MRLFKERLSAWRRSASDALRRSPGDGVRLGFVGDELTRACLAHECDLIELTPANFDRTLARERPDLIFVESAWTGPRDAWKYRIATYPSHPERNNADLRRLLATARDLDVPAVFWNKEDGVHFERFIDSARLFDFVFTVDASCVPRYRAALPDCVCVDTLPFAVQPAIHHYDGISAERSGACFVGSYSQHIHPGRRARQDALLGAAAATLGLTVYDRNSDRSAAHYRYPSLRGMRTSGKVPHERTAGIYKAHLASLNVNTVEDSETMFSRRLVEILACGGLAVTTPARSVATWFADYCHVAADADAALDLFRRLARDGYSKRDRDMMIEGAAYVLREHTYARRLSKILDAIGSRTGVPILAASA